jgi:hypothetical protein
VNEFTLDVISTAYDECRQGYTGNRRRKCSTVTAVTLDELVSQSEYVWTIYRNARIEEWANRLVDVTGKLTDREVVDLVLDVDDMLLRWGIQWEVPLWEPDGEDEYALLQSEQARFVACGIAGLWWLAMEGAEIAPVLHFTRDEVAAWLKEKQAQEALLVRRKTRSGEVVVQRRMLAM